MKILLVIFLLLLANSTRADENTHKKLHDYCSGYLSEIYRALDTIEDHSIISNIEFFFNENFKKAKYLNYDLYYDSNLSQFVINQQHRDLKKFKKINYPNFEIIILNSYINDFLLNSPKKNFCPSFGDNCSESSFKHYFKAAEDFSKSWSSYDSSYNFLNNEFKKNQCYPYLNTEIEQISFTKNLNILITLLLEQ